MDIRIIGVELPTRSWTDPRPRGLAYENIHVGLQRRTEVVEKVPGDSSDATWDFTVETLVTDEGETDFRGPFIHGKRGDRFLYLCWGTVEKTDVFHGFRRAKLMLSAVPPPLLEAATRSGQRLVGRLGLTMSDGGPRCAAVRPPVISWSVERAAPGNARRAKDVG